MIQLMIELILGTAALLGVAVCIVGATWFCVFKILDLWLGPGPS